MAAVYHVKGWRGKNHPIYENARWHDVIPVRDPVGYVSYEYICVSGRQIHIMGSIVKRGIEAKQVIEYIGLLA